MPVQAAPVVMVALVFAVQFVETRATVVTLIFTLPVVKLTDCDPPVSVVTPTWRSASSIALSARFSSMVPTRVAVLAPTAVSFLITLASVSSVVLLCDGMALIK